MNKSPVIQKFKKYITTTHGSTAALANKIGVSKEYFYNMYRMYNYIPNSILMHIKLYIDKDFDIQAYKTKRPKLRNKNI